MPELRLHLVSGEVMIKHMNSNATCHAISTPGYLKAMNVQNALGYELDASRRPWLQYESAIGKNAARSSDAVCAYTSSQTLLAVLGELA